MAGLVAAARARELGARGRRPREGRSLRRVDAALERRDLATSVAGRVPGRVPRRRSRAAATHLIDELDEGLDWLESLGAEVTERATGNPRTVGRRFDPRRLTDALVRDRRRRFGSAGRSPRRMCWRQAASASDLRASAASSCARAGGARATGSPTGSRRARSSRPGWTSSTGGTCRPRFPRSCSSRPPRCTERMRSCSTSREGSSSRTRSRGRRRISFRRPHGCPSPAAWYVVDARTLRRRVRERTVAEIVEVARTVGGDVRSTDELPFALPPSPKLVEPPFLAVRVRPAVTHTTGGLRIDDRARVLREDGSPIDGLYAAGADAGGIFTGGYGSGLAAALVFGRRAAESALEPLQVVRRVGREDDVQGRAAVGALLHREAAVQRRDALLDRVERPQPPLALAVVGDHGFEPAVARRLADDRDPGGRPSEQRLVERLADDLVEPDLLLLAELLRLRRRRPRSEPRARSRAGWPARAPPRRAPGRAARPARC